MNFHSIIALMTIVCAARGYGAEPTPITIELKPTMATKAKTITIGDLANLKGGADAERQRIARIDIADAPAGNRSLTIRARQVEFRLRLAGLPTSLFRITGAEETVVTGIRERMNAESIVNAARETLQRRLPWPADDLSIALVHPIVAELPPIADWETPVLKVEPQSPNVSLGRSQINVSIIVDGELRMTLPVLFEAKLLQKVAICRGAVQKGEILTEEKLFSERRPIEPNNRATLPFEQVIGAKAARAINPGVAIGSADVEVTASTDTALLVRPRQAVKMIVRLGAVNVVATGEAMQEGRLGQIIRVQNLDSKKVVAGRISGPALVEIETGGNP